MPDWKALVQRRLSDLPVSEATRHSLVEEIAADLEDRFAARLAAGDTPEEAIRTLEAELDELPVDRLLAAVRHVPDPPVPGLAGGHLLSGAWQDVRYAVRSLRRAPLVATIAIATLTLGIGASTAMFSVVDTVLLAPLPFPEPDRVFQIVSTYPDRGWARSSFSHANFWDVRDLNRSFADVGAITSGSLNMTGRGEPERLDGAFVSVGFFRALGVTPVAGRLFADGEDRAGGTTRVVLVAHEAWTTRFGRDPDIVGRVLTLDGEPYTVVGVLPRGTPWLDEAEIFRPLVQTPDAQRGSFELAALGRLKPGVTREQAERDLADVARTLRERFPEVNRGFHLLTAPSSEWAAGEATRRALWVLMGAVGCLLLIASANLVNLLLARAAGRAREIALRAALGASRFRLVRQMVVESLVLGGIGGAGGLLAAYWLVGVLRRMDAGVPRLAQVVVDDRVLLFTFAVAVGTSVATALVAALHGAHAAFTSSMHDAERGTTGAPGVQRLRQALVGVEVAIAMTLLVGAGLLVRSFDSLMRVDRGFRTDGRVLVQVSPPGSYDVARVWQIIDGVLERGSGMPGVVSIAAVTGRPLVPGSTGLGIGRPDAADEGSAVPWATWRLVTPEYFRTLGVPLLQGRTFARDEEVPPRSSGRPMPAIVSRRVANLLYPGEDPVGRPITLWKGQGDPLGEIVGVVGDIRERGLAEAPTLAVYLPYRGIGNRPVQFVVHTTTGATALAAALRTVLSGIDPDVPISNVATLDEVVTTSVASRRFSLLLFGGFSALALLLALGGIHGVLAYTVARRVPEIGVRLALGATPAAVVRMIVAQGMRPVVAGLVVGCAAALALSQLMAALLFEVAPRDAATYVAVAIAILIAGIVACLVPAMKAVKLDVTAALRTE